MGYSASSVQEDLITLPRDKVQEIWEGLRQAEEVGGIGHISWCDTIASGRYPETMEGVVQILSDYGFNVDLDNEGNVDLYSWGGDKLGSRIQNSFNHLLYIFRLNGLQLFSECNTFVIFYFDFRNHFYFCSIGQVLILMNRVIVFTFSS